MNQRNTERESALLPNELLWAEGGHASDVVLTSLADGQDAIVPREVLAHVHGCADCMGHLGNAALLSMHTGRELAVMRAEESPSAAKLPKAAIALGLLVAALGLLPSLAARPLRLHTVTSFATHDIPLYARALDTLLRKLFEPGSTAAIAVTYGSALLLLLVAAALVRLLPKKEVSS